MNVCSDKSLQPMLERLTKDLLAGFHCTCDLPPLPSVCSPVPFRFFFLKGQSLKDRPWASRPANSQSGRQTGSKNKWKSTFGGGMAILESPVINPLQPPFVLVLVGFQEKSARKHDSWAFSRPLCTVFFLHRSPRPPALHLPAHFDKQ